MIVRRPPRDIVYKQGTYIKQEEVSLLASTLLMNYAALMRIWHKDDTCCSSIIATSDSTKTFLASSVPNFALGCVNSIMKGIINGQTIFAA